MTSPIADAVSSGAAIASVRTAPDAMTVAVPSTDGDGVAWSSESLPQQTTLPVPA
jgi:hypothetical protein